MNRVVTEPPAERLRARGVGLRLRRLGAASICVVGLGLWLAGCGGRPSLVALPESDPRGGTATERTAAANYAAGLNAAWSGRYHEALALLRQADLLAPNQPLILAALGFVLDDLAHPEPDDSPTVYYNGLPNQGVLRREELDGRAFTYLNRAADLNIDDERVYERLAAHWHRVSRRPDDLATPNLTPADRRQAEGLSAHYSFLALEHLADEADLDLSRQKAMVYINHLRKFFQQRRLLLQELAVVRIHRRLEPDDWVLQLDEVELLYLTERLNEAELRLTRVEQSVEESGAPAAVVRRLGMAQRLGQRVRAATPAADWPRNPGAADATLERAELRWLSQDDAGLRPLWERIWRNFALPPANPFGP